MFQGTAFRLRNSGIDTIRLFLMNEEYASYFDIQVTIVQLILLSYSFRLFVIFELLNILKDIEFKQIVQTHENIPILKLIDSVKNRFFKFLIRPIRIIDNNRITHTITELILWFYICIVYEGYWIYVSWLMTSGVLLLKTDLPKIMFINSPIKPLWFSFILHTVGLTLLLFCLLYFCVHCPSILLIKYLSNN